MMLFNNPCSHGHCVVLALCGTYLWRHGGANVHTWGYGGAKVSTYAHQVPCTLKDDPTDLLNRV